MVLPQAFQENIQQAIDIPAHNKNQFLLHVCRVLRAGEANGDEVGFVLAAVDRNIEQNAADLPILIGFGSRISGQVAR